MNEERNELYSLIRNISVQHSYDEYTTNMLLATIPTMIEYYGEQYKDHILSVITEVPIVFVEKPAEMLSAMQAVSQPNVVDIDEQSVASEADVNMASGGYFSEPVLRQINGKFELDGTKRAVVVKKHDKDVRLTMSTLVHELSHAIKSFNMEYELSSTESGVPILTRRSGLNQEKQMLEFRDGTIIKTNIYRKSVGLEEGNNSSDEEHIMNKIIGQELNGLPLEVQTLVKACGSEVYKTGGYILEKVIAEELKEQLKCDLIKDSIEGTHSLEDAFEERIGSGRFDEFGTILDKKTKNFYQSMRRSPVDMDFLDGKLVILGYTKEFLQLQAESFRIRMQINAVRNEISGIERRKDISPTLEQALLAKVAVPVETSSGKPFYKINSLDDKIETCVSEQTLVTCFSREDGSFDFERFLDIDNPYSENSWQNLGMIVQEREVDGKIQRMVCTEMDIQHLVDVQKEKRSKAPNNGEIDDI